MREPLIPVAPQDEIARVKSVDDMSRAEWIWSKFDYRMVNLLHFEVFFNSTLATSMSKEEGTTCLTDQEGSTVTANCSEGEVAYSSEVGFRHWHAIHSFVNIRHFCASTCMTCLIERERDFLNVTE